MSGKVQGIRVQPGNLEKLDRLAKQLGISRVAVLNMVIAAIDEKQFVLQNTLRVPLSK